MQKSRHPKAATGRDRRRGHGGRLMAFRWAIAVFYGGAPARRADQEPFSIPGGWHSLCVPMATSTRGPAMTSRLASMSSFLREHATLRPSRLVVAALAAACLVLPAQAQETIKL